MLLIQSHFWATRVSSFARWRSSINGSLCSFESMQHVSGAVKRLDIRDGWLATGTQSELCWASWWREGGEAERKWTWRSDQNIVWQGNKVNWSQAAIPLETESMRVLFKMEILPDIEFRWIYSTIESAVNMFCFAVNMSCNLQIALLTKLHV